MCKKMKLVLNKWWKRHVCDFFPENIDEKFF